MIAKESLLRVADLEKEAQEAEERADMLRAGLEKITANYEAVHVQGGQMSREELIARLADAQQHAANARAAAVIYKDMILERINLLEDKRARDILKQRYIDHVKNWETIAATLHFSVRHALRIHCRALCDFGNIMPMANNASSRETIIL